MQVKIFEFSSPEVMETRINEFLPTVHRVVMLRVMKDFAYVVYKPDKERNNKYQVSLVDPDNRFHICRVEAKDETEAVTIAMNDAFEKMPTNNFALDGVALVEAPTSGGSSKLAKDYDAKSKETDK